MSDRYGEDEFSLASTRGAQRWRVWLALVVICAVMAASALVWWIASGGSGDLPSNSPRPVAPITATPSDVRTPSETATCEEFGTDQSSESSDDSSADKAGHIWGVDMRVGTHQCYDRWVFEFAGDGGMPHWWVRVHDSGTFMSDGGDGGWIEPLEGNAALEVLFSAWAYDAPDGPWEYEVDIVTDAFPAIQEARVTSSWEGISQVGLGLDEVRPYRVSWLTDPGRLVIDVYNR